MQNYQSKAESTLDLDLLLIDKAKEFNLSKDVYASAIENLVDDQPFPTLLFHTLQKIHENYASLNSFLGNMIFKIAQKRVWEKNSELLPMFLKCTKQLGKLAYTVRRVRG